MKNKKAFALIAAVLIIILFAGLGIFGASMLSTDINISVDTATSTQALYIAEAGIQYILEQLAGDNDWGDNPNISNINIAGGTFDVDYIAQTNSTATIKFTGTKADITRKVTADFERFANAFDYAIYAKKNIHTEDAVNLTITGNWLENGPDVPTVDFSYYQGIADQIIPGGRTFSAGTYSGIWYVDGNVNIEDNVIINGSIISTGNVDVKNHNNITITAVLPNPALVASGNFLFQGSEFITIDGVIYAGADMTGNFQWQNAQNINFNGTIIVGGNMHLQNTNNVTITYNPAIADNPPPGFSFSSGGDIVYDTWKETD